MKSWQEFIIEQRTPVNHPLADHPILHNFLWHLSSPHLHPSRSGKPMREKKGKENVVEGRGLDDIKADALKNQKPGNPYSHMKAGFHAAFPEGESEAERKTKESLKHFRNFMTERGGHAANNQLNFLGDNGKTRKSSGEGIKTVGLSLAPGTHSGYKHDLCSKASGECRKNCLGLTVGGNKQYPETAMRAKLLRTHYLHEHPEHAARVLSHEIAQNEHDAANTKEYHVGDQKFVSQSEANAHIKKNGGQIDKVVDSPHKAGVRLNVTSDIPYEHLLPKQFFDRHKNTQFYDYTKIPGRVANQHGEKHPENYHLTLSHTGANHAESNDKDAVHALNNGHVVAMVYHRGKDVPHPTHVEDVSTGKRWKISNGDDDDNTFDRHTQTGIEHGHRPGHGKEGVVSGLRLKGVKNEAAGKFANRVDPDGIIRINHPVHHPDHWNHEKWKAQQANPLNVLK